MRRGEREANIELKAWLLGRDAWLYMKFEKDFALTFCCFGIVSTSGIRDLASVKRFP